MHFNFTFCCAVDTNEAETFLEKGAPKSCWIFADVTGDMWLRVQLLHPFQGIAPGWMNSFLEGLVWFT